jgi:hypothetical protein
MLTDVRQRHLKTVAPWRTSDGGPLSWASHLIRQTLRHPDLVPATQPPVVQEYLQAVTVAAAIIALMSLLAGPGKQLGGPTAPSWCVATSNDGPESSPAGKISRGGQAERK